MPGRRWLKVPRHGTAVAYLALFVALGGTAYAANTVGSDDIIDESIQSVDIKNQTITTKDIAGADITGAISLTGVPNGRCSQVSLSVTGAKVGETAIISTQGPVQNGIVLAAQGVPSKGHVTVNACNFSGTTMTPISGLQIRVITFG
jgi:hypothetical protein